MTTTVDRTRVIVTFGPSRTRVVTCAHAHHHGFPDIEAEGESAREAVGALERMLAAALPSAPNEFRRGELLDALADVRAHLGHPA